MVKNIPTIERSTKIRFGKHATDDQAENTIVFNASNVAIDASSAGGVYVTPMRTVDPSVPEITVLSYNTVTKEIVNSNTKSADLFNSNLHFVSQRGNVTSNTLQFTNPTTAFITTGGVGIGSSVLIDSSAVNKVQVSGTIKTGALHADNIGIANTSPTHALSLGNEGQLRLNVPTGSIYALETVGNVSAQNYIGDGGLLSNVTLQTVTDKSNVTSNTLHLTNPTTSLKAYSNIIVDGKISAGTPIETTSGGTGHDTYIPGTILYGTDTGTSLGQLVPAGSNQDAGKFLRLDGSDIPEWAEVPLTLDAVLGNTTAVSDGSMDLTGLGTTITTAGKIKAAAFEGLGSELEGINASNLTSGTLITGVLPIVPVTKGGTGLNSVSTGDILYAPGTDQIANLAKGTANKVLQMNSVATLPEWTSTITGVELSGPTLDGVITTPGLNNNRIPFTNGSGELVSDTKLQFDGVNTMTVGSNLTISGNLLVQGNTTFQHTQNHTISDPLIELGNANASDTIDLGVIMTRPTSNVVAGYMGDEKKYVIAYTLSDPLSPHIVPTNATSDQFMTLSVEGGNVLAGNVITTSPIEMSSGGTGLTSVAQNELLLGPASGTTLTKLPPYNTDATKKFLRSNNSGVTWDDVSSTLQAITDGGATTSHTVAFNNATTGLTSAGDIDIAATKQIDYAGDILLKSSAGIPASLKVTNAIKLDPGPSSSTTVPAAMTANSSGGNTASSGDSSVDAYKAFDGSDSTHYRSPQNYGTSSKSGYGAFSSASNLGGVDGEWIKLQLPSAITPTSVFLKSRPNGTDSAGRPASWRILGSNDNTNWTQLHSSTTVVDDSSGTTESFTNTTSYSYLAFQVTNINSNYGRWTLSRLSFTDTLTVSPSNNVLSFNTTTGEIYDSGGQGGSTLDNIHEEGSNVAIGPSAASANLTVNTYGSNVLTVSGNVSADNITIGGLNVAASPFGLDDVVSSEVGSNVTSNVITVGGLVTSGNVDASNIIVSGNTTSQNIKLTNTDISATISSGTITIDAREKSYGTAPLVVSTTDVSNLVFSNLITGAQIVVPILASGGDINISKELTNVNFYAMTTDVSVTQDKHALMTLSNLYGNIYMNAIGFA